MFYIISTPIGNLKDLSYRAGEILSQVDVVLAEDTRSFQKIKKAISELFGFIFKKDQKVISYYKEKEVEKLPLVLDFLKKGKKVALISESGTPLISDPGSLLVQTLVKEGISFTFVPGPSAFVSAAVLSGFSFKEIVFLGFFPKKKKGRFFEKIKNAVEFFENPVFVFYESPHRIRKSLEEILKNFKSQVKLCVCREMTKKFEERIIIKDIKDLGKIVEKGEFTIVLSFKK